MGISRRRFIATSAASVASLSLSVKRKTTFASETSDIRVACIGVRGRGSAHLEGFASNVVAICDVDDDILHQRATYYETKHGRKLDLISDYRRLLDRKDIDAVSIATPNHTHALIAVAAAQAGKDIYCEKPISQTMWEGQQVVHAARKYDRIVQCGTQARSSESIKSAVDFVRSGALGKIRYAMGFCYKPRPSIGKLSQPLKIPSTVDYDLWCGPAEKVELFRPSLHYDWHWDFNTGNGDMGNQGIHQMDVARWFLGVNTLAPQVTSIGGRVGYEDAGNTPNSQVAYFDYPDAPLIFETRGLPRSKAGQQKWGSSMDDFRGVRIGTIVQCKQGYVVTDDNYVEANAFDNNGENVKRWKNDEPNHFSNWLRAVASRKRSDLNAEIHEGHLSSSLCLMGGISHKLGEKKRAEEIAEAVAGRELIAISFDRLASHLRANEVGIDSDSKLTLGATLKLDPESEMFVGNDGANELRTRKQRAPFIVPDIERSAT
jgi:predicted dehydrogenase